MVDKPAMSHQLEDEVPKAAISGELDPLQVMSEQDAIVRYVEQEAKETVLHSEKAASQLVGPARHDIWDVHCEKTRWWVVTNPVNLYDQRDFKSRDVVLTFHVGLMLRLSYGRERKVPVSASSAALLPGSWRRWEQAFEAYDSGDEAENFQSVGVSLRECLVSFVGETRSDDLVAPGETRPKDADFKAWTELLANYLAAGPAAARLRSYLKKSATETWEYVNWLTHAKKAVRLDAEIGFKIVEHLLGTFTAARLRQGRTEARCEQCESYRVMGGSCKHCGWTDPSYQKPEQQPLTEEELAQRLAEPCTPSSDISTFTGPDHLLRR
ncbi:MAG: hypothetical protein ABI895_40885 [Deltaproteobacteria bacterium]